MHGWDGFGGMGWGMGLGWLFWLVIILAIAALIKYLMSR